MHHLNTIEIKLIDQDRRRMIKILIHIESLNKWIFLHLYLITRNYINMQTIVEVIYAILKEMKDGIPS